MKTYLRISPTAAAVSAEGYIQTVHHPIEWVGSRSRATADYLESVLVTRQKLKNQLSIETTLDPLLRSCVRTATRRIATNTAGS